MGHDTATSSTTSTATTSTATGTSATEVPAGAVAATTATPGAEGGVGAVDASELARRESQLGVILGAFREALAADGGELHVDRVDVEAGEVWLTMAGACGSCGVAEASTQAGMRRILAERLDWFQELHVELVDSGAVGVGGWEPRHLGS